MTEKDRTGSLCPVCLKRIPALRVSDGENVYLVKECPDHGPYSRPLIWEGTGSPAFEFWKRPKIPTTTPRHPPAR